MNMKVAVRDKETGEVIVIERDTYTSVKDFRRDLNRNGFTVIGSVLVDGKESKAQIDRERAHRIGR